MAQDTHSIFQKIISGDRVVLGQALTLVESDKEEDRKVAIELLTKCEKYLGDNDISIRFTISGAPGVGKRTLIESLALKAISEGHKVGVITVDPTSHISQGSILGDKSRMHSLSQSPSAFIRSSPAGHVLGGISRRTKEMISLLAVAGYDILFLETVGVGQSEHIAWQLTDGFILVIQPGGGDELQGIKRGITELSDVIVVNKEDGSLREAAIMSRVQYQNAIHFLSNLRTGWETKVLTCSALENHGVEELWAILRLYRDSRLVNNQLLQERKHQDAFWLSWSLGITAHQLLMKHPVVNQKLTEALTNMNGHDDSVFKKEFDIENVMKTLITSSHLQNG